MELTSRWKLVVLVFHMITIFCLILVLALGLPLAGYYAYYLLVPRWIVQVIIIILMLGGALFGGFLITLYRKQKIFVHNVGRSLFIMVILFGASIGGIVVLTNQFQSPDLVNLSAFDQTGWESYNNTDWNLKESYYREQFVRSLGAFPQQVALEPLLISNETLEGYTRLKMSIKVENSGRSAWDLMLFYILIPDTPKTTPSPCLIVFHQHDGAYSKGKEEPVGLLRDPRQAFAVELVKQGYIAVAPDALCFSERQELSEYRTSKTLMIDNRTLAGKYVWDISRLIDYLITRSDINASQIGIMGHSLGGQMAIYCGAYDSRISMVISNCGIGKIQGNNSILEYNGEENEAFYLYGLASGDYTIDMKEIVGLIEKPIVIANGVEDKGLPIDGVAEIHRWCEQKYTSEGHSEQCLTIRFQAAHGIYPNTKQLMYHFVDSFF